MKPKPSLRHFLAALGGSILAISSASAQATLYWDGTPTTADGASDGGSGTWDISTANWDNGTSYQTWNNTNNDTAIFGGTAGTVTLGTDVTVGGLQFDTLNYLINSTASETITLATGATLGSSVGGDNTTTPKIDSNFAGSNGFTKTDTGRLFLNATGSTLTGDVNIASGQLYSRFEALGSGNIVFTGNSDFTKVYQATSSTTKSFTINDSVTASIGGSTFYYNFTTTGVLAGGNTAKLTMNMGGNTEKNFNNTSNTFTGELTVTGGGVGNATSQNGGRANFRSLADSSQKLIINNSNFRLNNGGVSMNFANRQLEILNHARIDNDSTNSSVTMSFAKDVLATIGNNSRTLYLAGVNTGDNTISGKISNSANGSGAVSVTKWEAGKWILSGDNTYTGTTTVSAGTLLINGNSSTATGNVTVGNTATLGGIGTTGGAVTVNSGGTLAPGASIESLVTGALTLNGGSTFAYEVNSAAALGVAADLLAVSGNLTLDLSTAAILTLTDLAAGTWDIGDKLTLISYSGTWNNGLFQYNSGTLDNNDIFSFGGVDWAFRYDDSSAGSNFTGDLVGSNYVTMTVIPEPRAALLGAIGLILLLRRRR